MIVVSDTSALTSLLAIGRERLLAQLFGTVIIPEAVRRELCAAHAELPAFVEVRAASRPHDLDALRRVLGAGESEAIFLAEELGADFLLMDEAEGRAVATQRGLRLIGLIGVLRDAKRAGILQAVRPDLDALQTRARFWISATMRERFLRDMGES